MIILHLVWMFLKLVRRKGVISHFFCLDVLKIRMKIRGSDLNRQIYPYLKMDLQHWFMMHGIVKQNLCTFTFIGTII